jgi:hypothetical protein
MSKKARAIAFYLPQFHPVPENDEWWEKGFTEWTNVTKAKPLFRGHHQPNLPGELGFYDLRLPEAREAQAQLAREYGIEGFCYWHYWFGNGRRILERVFEDVLRSGKPDLPFCLGWANETWTGIWHGLTNKILVEQLYPGVEDYRKHFAFLKDAFADDRYIKVDGKPLFLVYRPQVIPDLPLFVDTFREEAHKAGFKGIYLVGHHAEEKWDPVKNGLDAMTPPGLHKISQEKELVKRIKKRIKKELLHPKMLYVYSYEDSAKKMILKGQPDRYLPCVFPNWDNTPRSGTNGWVLTGATPQLFQQVLKQAVDLVQPYPEQERIVFIKSWNEWAEGNYLEPDRKFGRQYLEAVRNEIYNKGQ